MDNYVCIAISTLYNASLLIMISYSFGLAVESGIGILMFLAQLQLYSHSVLFQQMAFTY